MPQLYAKVDKEKQLKHGAPLSDVYAALQTFLGKKPATHRPAEELAVVDSRSSHA